MRLKEIWDDWTTFDEDGFINGIRSDAPEEVKSAYKKSQQEKEEQRKNGIKI